MPRAPAAWVPSFRETCARRRAARTADTTACRGGSIRPARGAQRRRATREAARRAREEPPLRPCFRRERRAECPDDVPARAPPPVGRRSTARRRRPRYHAARSRRSRADRTRTQRSRLQKAAHPLPPTKRGDRSNHGARRLPRAASLSPATTVPAATPHRPREPHDPFRAAAPAAERPALAHAASRKRRGELSTPATERDRPPSAFQELNSWNGCAPFRRGRRGGRADLERPFACLSWWCSGRALRSAAPFPLTVNRSSGFRRAQRARAPTANERAARPFSRYRRWHCA